MAEHSPGRLVYDADWRELKLEENGYVVAVLPVIDRNIRGKEKLAMLAAIHANGHRLAALWNAALAAEAVVDHGLNTTPVVGHEGPKLSDNAHGVALPFSPSADEPSR